MQSQEEEECLIEDAKVILLGKPYHWRDWSIVLHKGYLYLWSDAAVLQLSECSAGWFRFIRNEKITSMTVCGIAEKISDEYRREILKHLQEVCQSKMETGSPSQSILSAPGSTRLVFGTWSLFCNRDGEISVHHSIFSEQRIVLKEDMPGFIFESVIGEKRLFNAESSLGPEFPEGWIKQKEERFNPKSKLKELTQKEEECLIEDAKEILLGKPYHWRDWNIVLHKGYLYLWSDAAFLQFSDKSAGWFRFIQNGKIACMNRGVISKKIKDECRREILKHLQEICQSKMETGSPSQPILSAPGSTRLVFGTWSLSCNRDGEISVDHSIISKQRIVLKEDMPGFIFESDIGEKRLFTAESSLGPEFPEGWAKKREKQFNSKSKLKDLTQKENITKPKVGKCSYCKTILNEDILLFHEKDCVYRPTNCPDCSATMLLKDADKHCCKPAEEYNKVLVLEMDILSKNLKDLFTNENCWDTVLQVGDKEFKVHRNILSARSTVFSAMFQHDTSEKQTGIVNIPDCDPDSFKKFLEYIYCGKLENISSHCALNLYTISDKYNVQELKSFCIKYLTHNITIENICEVVILADAYDETALFSAIQDCFNENFKKIVITNDWENLMKKNFRLANKLLIEKSKAE